MIFYCSYLWRLPTRNLRCAWSVSVSFNPILLKLVKSSGLVDNLYGLKVTKCSWPTQSLLVTNLDKHDLVDHYWLPFVKITKIMQNYDTMFILFFSQSPSDCASPGFRRSLLNLPNVLSSTTQAYFFFRFFIQMATFVTYESVSHLKQCTTHS